MEWQWNDLGMRISLYTIVAIAALGCAAVGNAAAMDADTEIRPATAVLSPAAVALVEKWRHALAAAEAAAPPILEPASVAENLNRRVVIE